MSSYVALIREAMVKYMHTMLNSLQLFKYDHAYNRTRTDGRIYRIGDMSLYQ